MTMRTALSPLFVVGLALVGEPFLWPTPFTLRVVDARTGLGVPGLRITTDNGIVCYTRLNGEASWGEHSLIGRDVHFDIHDDAGRFGPASATLDVRPGGKADVGIRRQ